MIVKGWDIDENKILDADPHNYDDEDEREVFTVRDLILYTLEYPDELRAILIQGSLEKGTR